MTKTGIAASREPTSSEEGPSNFALALSESIMNGEALVLYPADLDRLSEYERMVLTKTAKRQRYHWRVELDTGKVSLEKDLEW